MSGYPWFAFYPADYLRKVGHLPLATQGLWMWMLCRMDESPRRGYLLYKTGAPIQDQDIPAMVIDTPGTVRRALDTLENHGVLSRDESGAMYSRRMVRDTIKRERERDKKRNARKVSPGMSPPMSPACPRENQNHQPETETETETKPNQTSGEGRGGVAVLVGGGGGSVADILGKQGIGQKVAAHLERGGVTPAEAKRECESVAADNTVRSKPAVIVHRLCSLHSIELPKGKRVDPEFAKFQKAIERRRA